jgi:hypothetical protein
MFARIAKNKVTQCHTIKTRVAQALNKPSVGIMTNGLPVRSSSAMQLSGLQMNNKMFIT